MLSFLLLLLRTAGEAGEKVLYEATSAVLCIARSKKFGFEPKLIYNYNITNSISIPLAFALHRL